jgi:phosphatidylserine/phosphatidylglycerophosphate/cardiolipin synthase-like enzyme
MKKRLLPAFLAVALFAPLSFAATADIQVGFSPEGSALKLVLSTTGNAKESIRLMAYSFTSPDVVKSLLDAHRRGVDVRVVVDQNGNKSKASKAALNLLVNAGIPTRTISRYKIMHDKVLIVDNKTTETGSFNYSRAADRSNSENVIVIRDNPAVAKIYLSHWQSRWEQGQDWTSTY